MTNLHFIAKDNTLYEFKNYSYLDTNKRIKIKYKKNGIYMEQDSEIMIPTVIPDDGFILLPSKIYLAESMEFDLLEIQEKNLVLIPNQELMRFGINTRFIIEPSDDYNDPNMVYVSMYISVVTAVKIYKDTEFINAVPNLYPSGLLCDRDMIEDYMDDDMEE